jgi:hypothetical protein
VVAVAVAVLAVVAGAAGLGSFLGSSDDGGDGKPYTGCLPDGARFSPHATFVSFLSGLTRTHARTHAQACSTLRSTTARTTRPLSSRCVHITHDVIVRACVLQLTARLSHDAQALRTPQKAELTQRTFIANGTVWTMTSSNKDPLVPTLSYLRTEPSDLSHACVRACVCARVCVCVRVI